MSGGLIIDSFAGGGGASTGIEWAIGRSPDYAINHDAEALALHEANHPETQHLRSNIWRVDPADVAGNRPVDLLWASPDCKHHSKAKGGRPVKRAVRDLAWVVVLWARRARPKVICLENVEEYEDWGPLRQKVDANGAPVVDIHGSPAWVPDPERRGETFRRWVAELRRLGYRVQWRRLRACDYGAPTIRQRLFVVARRDGEKIVWPKPTHGAADDPDVIAGRKLPWRTAADIIDWSVPCHSIFLSREDGRALGVHRPLADATMRRIARGTVRYVLDAVRPFIVPITHTGSDRVHSIDEPVRTITTAHRGELAFVAPTMVGLAHGDDKRTGSRTYDIKSPVRTVHAGGGNHALVAGFLAQHNNDIRRIGGVNPGRSAEAPLSTITTRGTQQQVVAAHLTKLYGTSTGASLSDPCPTVTAGGQHAGVVAAFLDTYYGTDQAPDPRRPLHTVTTRDRHSVVTVSIDGQTYALVDIGMRMLTPRELFRAQGFADDYIIDRGADGQPLTKTAQIRLCGNSVCPPVAAAIVRANAPGAIQTQEGVAA